MRARRPSSNYSAAPQIFRGIAAIGVVVFHAISVGGKLWGWRANQEMIHARPLGVDVFFVLSGFIIFHTRWRDAGAPGAARIYFLKRLARIYPLLFIVNTLKLAYMLAVGRGVPAEKSSVNSIIGSHL